MLAILLAAAMTSECQPIEKAKPEPDHGLRAITGAFVDLETVGTSAATTAETLARNGLCTVIYRADRPAKDAKAIRRMREFVNAAKDRRLTVYVGLNYGNISPDDPPQRLRDWADADAAAAAKLASLPFDGWYIAREIYNFRGDPKRIRKHYIERLMAKMKEDGRKVLISPYFNPADDPAHQLLGPKATAELFHALFAGSGITAAALQDRVAARLDEDSIGCHTWTEDEFLPQAAMYEKAFVGKFENSGVEAWINVESYEWPRGPAAWARLERQLRIVPKKAKRIVTWDFSSLTARPLLGKYTAAVKPRPCR